MVLGHAHRRHSLTTSNRSSIDSTRGEDNVTNEDETVVDADQGNMLTHIISQLRPGADLSRVTLPTFILEPRSMLERITNFMAHPETLLPMPAIDDPVERFVSVVKFYLSGWHIKPPGVKKPLNPILGETFTCYWDYPDHTRGLYISEQTSHHPPKSSYFYMAPEHHIRIDGTLKPRSKFLGNSAASMMEGIAVMRFLNRGERYFITQPNMYARGILFGKMKYELGDHSFVRCPESGLSADIEFKTKGYFGGTYNAIGGFIKDTKTDTNLYELSGLWTEEMYIKDLTTGKKQLLFDATHARETPPKARPISEQDERESQRLWQKVTAAIKARDQDTATDEKSRIEDMQREEAAKRLDDGVDWHPRLFRQVKGGHGGSEEGEEDLDFIINAKIDGKTPEEQTKQILHIAAILPGQEAPNRRFSIPSRKSSRESVSHSAHQHPPSHPQQSIPEDLIDFGGDSATPATAASAQQQQQPNHADHVAQQQHPGLQEPLVPTQSPAPQQKQKQTRGIEHTLVRTDSETGGSEEFVDAES
ncbi:oxysterol-binding protein [Mytilinidion resinicola]|uniref:Oxysterol-binding protein n=1 Tax=Mytilinidion resinicola TaxID=574789 RepID=A0A6A6YVE7_9PEZI|nr:oxysterol-binding protein [Mytilinidion resinicola]KAF2812926.1 oxysterol-binding protein [Mytilinidion resinicola]